MSKVVTYVYNGEYYESKYGTHVPHDYNMLHCFVNNTYVYTIKYNGSIENYQPKLKRGDLNNLYWTCFE